MTEKDKVNKDIAYNKKRIPILRVEATTADSEDEIEEMFQMKDDLIDHSGTAKQGVIDLYRFAKKEGFFDKYIMSTKANHIINDETQTLGELWQSVAVLASGRVEDNALVSEYPLDIRKRQVESLKHLVVTIEATHNQIELTKE